MAATLQLGNDMNTLIDILFLAAICFCVVKILQHLMTWFKSFSRSNSAKAVILTNLILANMNAWFDTPLNKIVCGICIFCAIAVFIIDLWYSRYYYNFILELDKEMSELTETMKQVEESPYSNSVKQEFREEANEAMDIGLDTRHRIYNDMSPYWQKKLKKAKEKTCATH